MKNLHMVTEATSYPQFWDEESLKKAISELDMKNMTDEQLLACEMAISANVLVIKNEEKKIAAAKAGIKNRFIKNALDQGLEISLIAELVEVSVEFVESVQEGE